MTDRADFLWALRYIVEHSPMNAGDSANLIGRKLPNVGQRYDRILARAFNDPAFDPTPEARARLTALLGSDTETETATRNTRLELRLSQDERDIIDGRAAAAGLSVAGYIREKALG